MPEEKKLNVQEYVNIMRSKIILSLNNTGDLMKETINELFTMLDTQLKLNESLRNQLEQKDKEMVKLQEGLEKVPKESKKE